MQKQQKNRLPKSERLCSTKRIDALFARGRRTGVGPVKCCYLVSEGEGEGDVSVMFSVPKKLFKRAWERNLIKRRMRDSYRHRKETLTVQAKATSRNFELALICSSSEIPDYKTIDDAITRILSQILAHS